MNFRTISNAVTSRIGRQVLIGQKHSPAVLFVVGVIGVGATVVLACRATLKLEDVLEEAQENIEKVTELRNAGYENYSEGEFKKDVALVYTRTSVQLLQLYGPAVAVGLVSVAALTGSHVILNKRNVALTAAFSSIDKAYKEYRRRVIEAIGEDKERELRYESSETREFVEVTEDGKEVKKTERIIDPSKVSPYARFFDEYSSSWNKTPEYNQLFVNCQQNYANDLLKTRGHVFLNEVYDMLGLARSKEGQIVGWVMGNGDNYIDFGVFKGNTFDAMRFVSGNERSILLDFNVDGNVLDLI